MVEGAMVGWGHQLNGHEFEQALGDGQGQGRLECYSLWDCKELDTTEQLQTESKIHVSSMTVIRQICLILKSGLKIFFPCDFKIYHIFLGNIRFTEL